jgi:hypothetical protein
MPKWTICRGQKLRKNVTETVDLGLDSLHRACVGELSLFSFSQLYVYE